MLFLTHRTYALITPESAEQGDFADTGTVSLDIYSLRELIQVINLDGFSSFESGGSVLETESTDYKTGETEIESLHLTLIQDSTRFMVWDSGEGPYRWTVHALGNHSRDQVYATKTREEARELVAKLNRQVKSTLELIQLNQTA